MQLSYFGSWRCQIALSAVVLASWPALAQAPTADRNTPLFSTPPERSQSSVPVLEDPRAQNSGDIIENFGGGTAQSNGSAQADQALPPAPQPDQIGQPSPPSQAVSQALTTTEIGPWTLQCLEQVSRGPQCQVLQQVASADQQQIVLVFSITKTPGEEQFPLQIAVPLGISIPEGIELTIGESYSSVLPIARCTAQGCISEGIAAAEMMDAMLAADGASAVVRDQNGNPIDLQFSLLSFAEAKASMEELEVVLTR